jgi:hypothetical protein
VDQAIHPIALQQRIVAWFMGRGGEPRGKIWRSDTDNPVEEFLLKRYGNIDLPAARAE